MTIRKTRHRRDFSLAIMTSRLLCGAAMTVLGAAAAQAEDGTLRILTLNTWGDQYANNLGVTSDFFINGNYDIIALQESRTNTKYIPGLTQMLGDAGLGTYAGTQISDVSVVSRLSGTFGSSTLGDAVAYQKIDAQNGVPQTIIGSVHLNYYDEPNARLNEVKGFNSWAASSDTPIILVGDFNAGDVSERGLHNADQQSYLYARTIIDSGSSALWKQLAKEYTPEGKASEYEAYAASMKVVDDNGTVHYRNVIQDYFNAHRDEFPGKTSYSQLSWRQWEAIIAKDMAQNGITFEDETYPVESNTPVTMNVLKKQYMLLTTEAEREPFAPHELGDGTTTWPSAGEDATNTWTSWDRVTIDHFMVSRPFGKWYTIVDDPNDAYTGVLDDVGFINDGSAPLADHEPVAHTLKWIGPALETYTETVDNAEVEKTRLVWGSDATVFEEKNKEFYLTRNNMRTDVYLGQISDENGNPILTDLTLEEKKTLLDCTSTDPRFQQAIVDYCIDDHSFIGETLITDGGTVIVDEDAALGTSAASLHLDNGTLRIAGTDMALLDRAVVLEAGGGGIDIAEADNAVAIARAISGTGALTKLGEGALGLLGQNTYTGETRVEEGLLVVNGSIATSALTTVFDGAALAGTGTVGNLRIASGGAIAPGQSIGTLNVAGNLSFAAGSFYEVEVNAEGQSDLIAVTGATTIEGGSVIGIAAGGDYLPETAYTILTSAGGIEGAFDDVTSSLAFLDPTLSYGATEIQLTLARNDTAFDKVGYTSNQQSAARGAESLGYGNALYNAIVMQDAATARSIFTQIGGELHASTAGVLVGNSRFVRDAMNDRLLASGGETLLSDMAVVGLDTKAPRPVAADTKEVAMWMRGFGAWNEVDGNGNASGLSSNTGGVLGGLDAGLPGNWRVGMLAGYSQTSVSLDDLAASANSDNVHLGVYAGTQAGPVGVRLGAAYTWHSIDSTRQVNIPTISERLTADYDATTTQAFGELGYRFEHEKGMLEPFVNLAYVHFSNDSFAEQGGVAALGGGSDGLDTFFTTLGLRASHRFDLGGTQTTLHGTVGWQYASGDITPEASLAFAGGDVFSVAGAPIAENVAVLGARIEFAATEHATISVGYDGQFGSGQSDNSLTGTLSVRF
ncbi:autotransporter domain-containing protein [Ancylobacter rudongensis]|uniref:Outer membrane autotransporter barrel domain-containing protein n=1 Tax=Ancylobacter rudongensis TaxID=177413 RepID=A0A1G4TJE1_9HYPH|nr:autotransporter domain-containing protein [Ancylobacter rudongensis]SCW81538.1 outer membrane autotransporter barrel domain-containing protein [Ancylobacter rudongensis]